ncbi:MAG: hypothetical protein EOM72_10115 [Opitutae bacterium]|nr:hypothetical protein [Opitutae bacterium]
MRNGYVELSVSDILTRLDELCKGQPIGDLPSNITRKIFDDLIVAERGSVRLAAVFLLAYSVRAKRWNFKSVPIGIRGKYGDKRLAAALTERHVTLHQGITAFGENLGWKGNVRNVNLSRDPRFRTFIAAIMTLDQVTLTQLREYAVYKLFESRVIPRALPPLPRGYLTYARALLLCEKLLALPSEGHIQQFLVAGFLKAHRQRFGHDVTTHHPHASDTFDAKAGDIEEFREGALIAAYEVTVRDDWKNRLPDFERKASTAGLQKYAIFASRVHDDERLASAAALLDFLGKRTIDIAVVDIRDFFAVFCSELRADEIQFALNQTYEYLMNPKLCGKQDFLDLFAETTGSWMDAQQSAAHLRAARRRPRAKKPRRR